METQNEKGGSAGSGRTTGQQYEGIGIPGGKQTTSAAGATRSGAKSRSGNIENNEGNFLSDLGVNTKQVLTALGVVAGGALLYKGAKALIGSGKSGINKKANIEIRSSLEIKKPKDELYAYWRNLENLPNFMSHIEEVNELNDKRSHWVAEVPGGLGHIEWEAEIVWEQKNQLLAWRSLPDSDIENSGEVRFQDAGNGKRTIVETTISYRPPAGRAGGLAAKLLNPAFKKVVESDLKEFKNLMERGSISRRKPSVAGRM